MSKLDEWIYLLTHLDQATPEQHLSIEHGAIILGEIAILIFILLIYIKVCGR